jgi:hypothetical protein
VKKLAMVIGFSACLLSLLLAAGVTQAEDLDKQTELLASCQRIQPYLTLPLETSVAYGADQKALLAVTLAASKAGISNPAEILSVYKQAQDSTTHLLMIDSSFVWSGTQWMKRTRTSHTYGSNNLQAGETVQIWDGEWIDSTRLLTSYDGTGRSLISTTQDWKDTGWQNMEKATYTYDDIDMTIEVVWQYWRDNSGWDWVDTLRTTSVLTDGLLSTVATEKWDGLEWVSVQKITYTYNASNILTQILGQTWSGTAWVNNDLATITYNALVQDTSDLAQTWTGSWTNSTRTQHSYDGQGNCILNVRWTWGGAVYSKTYADTLKHHSGHFVEGVRYVVATDSLERTQYSYDPAYDFLVQELYQYYDGDWVNVRKTGYYWQQVLVVSVDGENGQRPSSFGLAQNYPNPFNPMTVIRYSLSQRSQVSIAIFNILGQEVTTLVDKTQPAGAYETIWDGIDRSGQRVGSGIYFYRITAGDFSETRKMVLLK